MLLQQWQKTAESGVPVIHIGGGSPITEDDTGPLQDVNSFGAMEAFCKWARRITCSARIPEYVSMAFRNALDGTPGPVYLEIPADVLFQQFDEESIYWPEDYRTEALPFGDPELIERRGRTYKR